MIYLWNVFLPPVGASCDVHARFEDRRPAYLAVYDREAQRWYTSADSTLSGPATVAALRAIEVRQ